MEKIFNTKVINNIARTDEWETIKDTFVPLEGELIIYSDLNNIKIGDGRTAVGNLKFIIPVLPTEEGKYLLNVDENQNISWEKITQQ